MNQAQSKQEIGVRLKQIRHLRGLTQAQVAKTAKMSRAALVNIEQGRQGTPVWTLLKLSAALGVPPHVWLYNKSMWGYWISGFLPLWDTRKEDNP